MDALQTQTVNSTTAPQPNYIPGLIAVVGCDGTGKSTLTTDLVKSLQQHWQTERRYLGLLSGEDGDKIKRLPLVGVWLERRLAAKSSKTQSMKTKSPALWAAVIMYCFSLRRMANLARFSDWRKVAFWWSAIASRRLKFRAFIMMDRGLASNVRPGKSACFWRSANGVYTNKWRNIARN
ncbi:Conserved protein YghR, with nucleoside triphosphate hydrolase domain [Escherichia coli IS25]|nr:Conserved protein YghR, with nucleoside triphosphate hydrolase domain [Escherichia coli IS25]